MIVSHQHRLIFVKTYKTAGTSIELFLAGRVGPDAIVTPINPPVDGHEARNFESTPGNGPGFRNHLPASTLRTSLGADIWREYTSFCVDRNPWDQVVSTYFMRKSRNEPSLRWEEFLDRRDFYRNHLSYTDPDDRRRVLVDRVVRYEDLHNGLGEVFAAVGISFDGDLGARAKGEYRTDRRHYRDFYTAEQAGIVAEELSAEIALNHYSF
ncbi:MAG: hypothetical protein RIB98_16755 [Acidimicrobiales bacterium]